MMIFYVIIEIIPAIGIETDTQIVTALGTTIINKVSIIQAPVPSTW